MRKIVAAIFVATALLAIPAMADPIVLTNGGPSVTLSYQSAFFAGSKGTATYSLSGDKLTIVLTNTSTDTNTRVTGIALNVTPNVNVAGVTGSSIFSTWNTNGGGVGGYEVSDGSGGNCSTVLCVGVGNTASGSMVFTLQSILAPPAGCHGKACDVYGTFSGNLTIDQSIIHLISLPDGSSEKPEGELPPPPPPPPPPPGVPEPGTVVLLGTGLIGAAGALRRKFNI